MTNVRRELLMPSVTPSTTAGKISRWHVAEGQAVSAGDVLVEVATATATLEIEAENAGQVERILVPAGTDNVEVNTPIAILLGAGAQAFSPGLAAPLTFAGLAPTPRDAPRVAVAAAQKPAREQTFRGALHDALLDEMTSDPQVFVIGADVALNRGAPRVTQGLLDTFGPHRVVSVASIDEATIGMAVGAAFAGLKPVVELASWGRALEAVAPYLMSAAETFALSGGRLRVPIVFRGGNGLVAGMTGQSSRCVASYLAQIPGLKVVQPATPLAAKGLLRAAIRDGGPVAVLEDSRLYDKKGEAAGDAVLALGVAQVVRVGRDVTIAAAGHAVEVAISAAHQLSRNGIEVEVVDLMSVHPLDAATVAASVSRTGRLATLEEGWGDGGLGAELIALLLAGPAFSALKCAPRRIAGTAVAMPYAADLQAAAVPQVAGVVSAVMDLLRT